MANAIVNKSSILPNSATKEDCHDLVDNAVASVSGIVNADIKSDAAIAQSKLATLVTPGKVNLSSLVIAGQTAGDTLWSNDGVSFVRLPIGTAGQQLTAGDNSTELDYMDYSTDALAQAAYVSNAVETADQIPDMTDNNAPSGLVSASSIFGTYYQYLAMNDSNSGEADCWYSGGGVPQWLQYRFASAKMIGQYTISARDYTTGGIEYPTAWTLLGSNDGSTWITLDTQTGQTFTQAEKKSFTFLNFTAYTYYRLNITASQHTIYVAIGEFELILASPLQCYSEDTIKVRGGYSLQGVALKTESLNKTFTRTVSPVIDLTDQTAIKFSIRSSRIGANIKIGIHDSGGTTSEKTYTIVAANTWETVTWDISGITNANKNAIDSIIITIIDADVDNIFYIDNMFYGISPFVFTVGWVTP